MTTILPMAKVAPVQVPDLNIALVNVMPTLQGNDQDYGAAAQPFSANIPLSVGYEDGVMSTMPGGVGMAGRYANEQQVMFDAAGYGVLGQAGVRPTSGGLALALTHLTTTQQKLLQPQFQAAKWRGASLTTWPRAGGPGVYQWTASFAKGKGFWQALELFDENSVLAGNKTEVDIEFNGDNPTFLDLTLHWTDAAGKSYSSDSTHYNAGVDLTMGLHTYEVAWAVDFITWYLDGKRMAYVPTPALFGGHQVQMMANAAVSDGLIPGWYPAPDASTPSIAYMHIGSMRHWDWAA